MQLIIHFTVYKAEVYRDKSRKKVQKVAKNANIIFLNKF